MDFPTYPLREVPVTDEMEQAFGIQPVKAVLGLDLICVFENEEQVRSMQPDQIRLMKLEGRIQNVTARGTAEDCVSRSFCPKLSIAEDPVCGSAHCQIADYWSGELNNSRSLHVRPQNAADTCIANCGRTAGSISAEKQPWWQSQI